MVEQQEKMLLLIRMPDEIQERARRGGEEVIFEIAQRMPKENIAETAAGSFLGIATICILLIISAIIMRKNK